MHHTTKTRLPMLDVIRGMCAVIVMAGHLRNALLPDYSQLTDPNLLLRLFYLISGLGHQAVIVFFVLSGYLVGGAVIKSGDHFKWRSYATSRISRLWAVLIPAIILTCLLDFILLKANPNIFDQFHRTNWHSLPATGQYSTTLWTGVQNILFLQTVTAPTYGTNGPLWSLANEAWYYVLFPCVFIIFRTATTFRQKLLCFAVFFIATLIIPVDMIALFPIWLMGACLHFIRTSTAIQHWLFGLVALSLALVTSALARIGATPMADMFLGDYLVGFTFAAWCLHLHQSPQKPIENRLGMAFHTLSEMSFSLYAIHMPIIFLLVGSIFPTEKILPNGQGILIFITLSAAIITTSWVFWWAFERNTPAVRKKLSTWLNKL